MRVCVLVCRCIFKVTDCYAKNSNLPNLIYVNKAWLDFLFFLNLPLIQRSSPDTFSLSLFDFIFSSPAWSGKKQRPVFSIDILITNHRKQGRGDIILPLNQTGFEARAQANYSLAGRYWQWQLGHSANDHRIILISSGEGVKRQKTSFKRWRPKIKKN